VSAADGISADLASKPQRGRPARDIATLVLVDIVSAIFCLDAATIDRAAADA